MNIFFAIIAGLGFGLSMFFRKLGVKYIGMPAFIAEAIVEMLFAFIMVSLLFPYKLSDLSSKTTGLLFGIGSGISISIGVISYYLAVRYGQAIVPSIISPVLSATSASILAIVILGESLSAIKFIGLIIALIGLLIFSLS